MNPPPNLPEIFGHGLGHRKLVRQTRTKELALRSGHRRLAKAIRTGVLVMFGFAMVIYPIFGTLSPAAHAAEKVPGVILGIVPSTVEVILGEAPTLTEGAPELPNADDLTNYLATSSPYLVSALLPECDGSTEWSGTNGNMTDDSLCALWNPAFKVRSDAAISLAQLNEAFKLQYGRDICLESGYRSISDQFRVKSLRGYLAARPGESPHGWGVAIDICRVDSRGEKFDWFKAHAPAYGWENPPWASTSLYEPWHWEYFLNTPSTSFGSGSITNGEPSPGPSPTTDPTPVPTTDPTPEPSPDPTTPPPPAPSPSPSV